MDNDRHLFPAEFAGHTAFSLVHRNHALSALFYSLLTALVIGCLLVLPFVKVAISLQSPAIIRPASEISTIRSPVSGRLQASFAHENQHVKKGEVLYVLESDVLTQREDYLTTRMTETREVVADIRALLTSQPSFVNTPLLQQGWASYRQKLAELTTRCNKAKADYDRNLTLHRERVIADAEFEVFQFEYTKAQHDRELFIQNQRSQWQGDLRTFEKEVLDLQNELSKLEHDKENLIIKAPIAGSLQNLAGVYPGSTVSQNHELAQLSPDTTLIVEVFVNPNDIGLLRTGMPVLFQVDAFHYNQWGLASGQVVEISNDVYINQEKPVFKVTCGIHQQYLQLKNGYKGYLKKGMTLQARFSIAERTLWQLLYDKADDWLNPNQETSNRF
jgi:HlyD family secretion protein